MNTSWRVSVEVARDDHAPLTEEALRKLTGALADDRTAAEPQESDACSFG